MAELKLILVFWFNELVTRVRLFAQKNPNTQAERIKSVLNQSQFQKIWPESDDRIDEYFIFLNLLERKGFYEILGCIGRERSVSYKQVECFAAESNLAAHNKASVRIILNALSNMGLIDSNSEPLPNTTYKITGFGRKIIGGSYSNP